MQCAGMEGGALVHSYIITKYPKLQVPRISVRLTDRSKYQQKCPDIHSLTTPYSLLGKLCNVDDVGEVGYSRGTCRVIAHFGKLTG